MARAYEVVFEEHQSGVWTNNAFKRVVFVNGGAEQAIKVARERERADREETNDEESSGRWRVESVQLITQER